MNIAKVHCLFEQSGTFKGAFQKLGIPAEDYDILNQFEQTDHVVDLFSEIEKGFEGQESIFDTFSKDDLVFCFFPCTRFDCQIYLGSRGEAAQMKKWSDEKKLDYSRKLHEEISQYYSILCKLFSLSLRGGGEW